ncbi:hypothetical protein MSIMFI_05323 [Mycobacterium simulans]|nr:hypothetical protein MSIMFI_05323 [Mycobacterium simulans]
MALLGKHLTERIPDVHHSDIGCIHLGRDQRFVDDLRGEVGKVAAFPSEVASEVALIAAQNPYARGAIHTRHGTPAGP